MQASRHEPRWHPEYERFAPTLLFFSSFWLAGMMGRMWRLFHGNDWRRVDLRTISPDARQAFLPTCVIPAMA